MGAYPTSLTCATPTALQEYLGPPCLVPASALEALYVRVKRYSLLDAAGAAADDDDGGAAGGGGGGAAGVRAFALRCVGRLPDSGGCPPCQLPASPAARFASCPPC